MRKFLLMMLLTLCLSCSPMCSMEVHAARSMDYYSTPQKVRATCYVQTGITKSGQPTRKGVVAGREEWLGKFALLYRVNEDGTPGRLIGVYEFLDTGGTDGLKNGTVIDIWADGMDGLDKWISMYGDYVYLQIVPKT